MLQAFTAHPKISVKLAKGFQRNTNGLEQKHYSSPTEGRTL